jgi:hypothetical protein
MLTSAPSTHDLRPLLPSLAGILDRLLTKGIRDA